LSAHRVKLDVMWDVELSSILPICKSEGKCNTTNCKLEGLVFFKQAILISFLIAIVPLSQHNPPHFINLATIFWYPNSSSKAKIYLFTMKKYRALQLGLQLGFTIAMNTCNSS
jgi:hypothetical protein